MINKDLYFILSSDCKIVRGLKRCVIVDYQRSDIYFITHDYFDLLEKMDRKKVSWVETEEIDADSQTYFQEFLSFIQEYEIGVFTDKPENFPPISEDAFDEYLLVKDVIVEVDQTCFNIEVFKLLCKDLDDLHCKDFQIRLLSEFDRRFVQEIIDVINDTSAHYLEIHCTFKPEMSPDLIHDFIETNRLLNQLYLYGCSEPRKVEIFNERNNKYPVSLGYAFYINYPFDNGACCGQISHTSLNFTSLFLHGQLKVRNGCLDRKITIDRYGDIKNCPSLRDSYGNTRDVSIKDVLVQEGFQKYWYIHKDQIDTCKVCEFRYNCTDCRAYLVDPTNIYSKPLKCGYDPSTCKWEDEMAINF